MSLLLFLSSSCIRNVLYNQLLHGIQNHLGPYISCNILVSNFQVTFCFVIDLWEGLIDCKNLFGCLSDFDGQ